MRNEYTGLRKWDNWDSYRDWETKTGELEYGGGYRDWEMYLRSRETYLDSREMYLDYRET